MPSVLSFLKKIKEIFPILTLIRERGGIPYLVGGSVRDLVMGYEVKDFDIEVHNISLKDLEACLRTVGAVSLVGKKFGVLKVHGSDIDWSLPRRDSIGRKPDVIVDPGLTIEEASRRRDVTINAMAIDLLALVDNFETMCSQADKQDSIKLFKIIDPYGGLGDIERKILRYVDKTLFVQDPLRFYRVMQFVGRFEMVPDEALNDVCKAMNLRGVEKGGELARERIYEEIKKLLLKSRRPSLGFRWLHEIGRLKELFPELEALVGVEQRIDYHPEVDAFEHTMQALDASAKIELSDDGKFTVMLAALCHDLGKAEKTDDKGSARGHDVAGVPLAKKLLQRFTWNSRLITSVCKLVRFHRMPIVLVQQESTPQAYKRLATKLAPEVTMIDLYWLSWSDIRGRNKDSHEPLERGFGADDTTLETFLVQSREAKIDKGPEVPVLHGRDLLDVVPPGREMGELLRKAYSIQIEEGIIDPQELKSRVLK